MAFCDGPPGSVNVVGGTSDAAPMAAGVFALLNDAIGGCRLGAPHFELYQLGAAQLTGGTAVFHDITLGNLSQDGITVDAGAPAAHAGFDDATGWGSLDIAALAGAWPHCPTTGTASGPVFLADGGLPLNDAGLYDPGQFQPGAFDGGGLDAGRGAYDPCAVIACDGGSICVPSDAGGPAMCVTPCTPGASPSTCSTGSYCEPTSNTCQFGCLVTTDCATGFTCEGAGNGNPGGCAQNCDPTAADAGCPAGDNCLASTSTCGTGCNTDQDCPTGKACETCLNRCVTIRDGGGVGATCASRTDCATGELCLTAQDGFPNGYCSAFCGGGTTCGCPSGAVCLDAFGLCLSQCTLGQTGECGAGLVCDGIGDGQTGGCLPPCGSDADCNTDPTQTVCDTSTGICVTALGTTSSSGSSGSTSASTSSGSTTGTSSSTGASTGSTGTEGSTTGTTTAGSSAGATAAGATSGSTGSTGGKKSGCGCNSGADLEAPLGLLLGAVALLRRRRR